MDQAERVTISLRSPSPVPSDLSSSNVTLKDVSLIKDHLDAMHTSAMHSSSMHMTSSTASSSTASSSSISLSTLPRSSKRSSSTSNDLVYERDRFRARLHTMNGGVKFENTTNSAQPSGSAACVEDKCEVCDEVGLKTTKLSHNDTEEEEEEEEEEGLVTPVLVPLSLDRYSVSQLLSPLDPSSTFFAALPTDHSPNIDIKLLTYGQLDQVFHWYFNKPLPPTNQMFPWLHGLHKDNFAQKQFFLYQHHQQQQKELNDYNVQQLQVAHDYSFEDISKKPENVRFLMTINTNTNPKISSYLPVLKNNVLLSEILEPIDVSRMEMTQNIRQLVVKLFRDEDNDVEQIDELVAKFVADCIKINHLPIFLNLDPDFGVSLRNFHIQVSKLATFADFIIYKYNHEPNEKIDNDYTCSIARVLWLAQRGEAYKNGLDLTSQYNTYIVKEELDIQNLISHHNDLFTINPSNSLPSAFYAANAAHDHRSHRGNTQSTHFDHGTLTSLAIWDGDYQVKERLETTTMSSATRINKNVWVGNVWDCHVMLSLLRQRKDDTEDDEAVVDDKDKTPIMDLESEVVSSNEGHRYCDPSNSVIIKDLKTFEDPNDILTHLSKPRANWRLMVHCYDNATFPDLPTLANLLFKYTISLRTAEDDEYHIIDFPPSGSVGLGNCKVENLMSIINLCKLLYLFLSSNLKLPDVMSSLIYCSDGFTELSLIVLCYLIYSENIRLDEAMIKLHTDYGRPFYIFNSDVQILRKLEPLLKKFSPADSNNTVVWGDLETISSDEINDFLLGTPQPIAKNMRLGYIANDSDSEEEETEDAAEAQSRWVEEVEGSLPSRILPYLYLGSLKHANNLTLMNKLGIKHIISAGEQLDWLNGYKFKSQYNVSRDSINDGNIEVFTISPRKSSDCDCIKTVMKVNHLQDDGIDELSGSLSTVLEFINEKYELGGSDKILVHCRVGVSRSATIVISEVMRRLNIDLPRAYLYVRVRRLNIVIQPNLRFMYELFKWEEKIKEERRKMLSEGGAGGEEVESFEDGKISETSLREIDWFVMCREIMRLNISYLNS